MDYVTHKRHSFHHFLASVIRLVIRFGRKLAAELGPQRVSDESEYISGGDGGVENFNGAVDELIHSGLLHRAWGRHGNHVFQFPDRILVAGTQTPMAVPVRQRAGESRWAGTPE